MKSGPNFCLMNHENLLQQSVLEEMLRYTNHTVGYKSINHILKAAMNINCMLFNLKTASQHPQSQCRSVSYVHQ